MYVFVFVVNMDKSIFVQKYLSKKVLKSSSVFVLYYCFFFFYSNSFKHFGLIFALGFCFDIRSSFKFMPTFTCLLPSATTGSPKRIRQILIVPKYSISTEVFREKYREANSRTAEGE